MLNDDISAARRLLSALVRSTVTSVESSEYRLRIVFDRDLDINVYCPWRVLQNGAPVFGSGDVVPMDMAQAFAPLTGLCVMSASVLPSWDAQFYLGNDYCIEVIPDSVRYEAWVAHLEAGNVVFSGGAVWVFPRNTLSKSPSPLDLYSAEKDFRVTPLLTLLVTELMQDIQGLRSVGIAGPSQTGCVQKNHDLGTTFDIVELNGLPLAKLARDEESAAWLRSVQLAASKRGALESYGPAGIFQNGSQILVPALEARFKDYLHIATKPLRRSISDD
jgi:hypothetical protein